MVTSRSRWRAGLRAVVLLAGSIIVARPAEAMPAPREAEGVRVSEGATRRAASTHRPFEGFWGADRASCTDPDSAGRMAIQADTIQWYETRCDMRSVVTASRATWRVALACRGEGQRIAARATLRLPTPDSLVIENGPIGPARRQRYIRCLRP